MTHSYTDTAAVTGRISAQNRDAHQPTESRHRYVFAGRPNIVPLRRLRRFRFRRSRAGATDDTAATAATADTADTAATTGASRGHRIRGIRDAVVVGDGRLFRRITRTDPRVPQDQSGDRPGPRPDQTHFGHHGRRGAVHPDQQVHTRGHRTKTGRGDRPGRPGRGQGF